MNSPVSFLSAGPGEVTSHSGRSSRATGGRVAVIVTFAALIVGASMSSAFAGKYDNRGRGNPHNAYDHRGWNGGHPGYRPDYRGEYRRPYLYAQPVYAPPPVYYEPQQSPGISLFFPLDVRRR